MEQLLFQVLICRHLSVLKRQEFVFFSARVWWIKWQVPCNVLSMEPYSEVYIYPYLVQPQDFFWDQEKLGQVAIFYKPIWTALTFLSKSHRIVHVSNIQLYEWPRSVRQHTLCHQLLSYPIPPFLLLSSLPRYLFQLENFAFESFTWGFFAPLYKVNYSGQCGESGASAQIFTNFDAKQMNWDIWLNSFVKKAEVLRNTHHVKLS